MSEATKAQRDEWRKLARSRVAPVIEHVFRPQRSEVIPVLAAMADVSESWLRAECERTSLEGMLVVLDVVRDRDGGAAYWERLCAQGVLPIEWLEDPSRGFFTHSRSTNNPEFVSPQLTPGVVAAFEERSYLPHPKRALDALTLACNAATMSAIESLARESLRRFSQIEAGAPTCVTARWHILRNGGTTEDLWPLRRPLLDEPFSRASLSPAEVLVGSRVVDRFVTELLATPTIRTLLDLPNTRARSSRVLVSAALGHVLDSCAWTVFGDSPIDSAQSDVRYGDYGDYDDPFEPLARVVESGYFVERFDAKGIALIAASL